jgi:hypothetical protein
MLGKALPSLLTGLSLFHVLTQVQPPLPHPIPRWSSLAPGSLLRSPAWVLQGGLAREYFGPKLAGIGPKHSRVPLGS